MYTYSNAMYCSLRKHNSFVVFSSIQAFILLTVLFTKYVFFLQCRKPALGLLPNIGLTFLMQIRTPPHSFSSNNFVSLFPPYIYLFAPYCHKTFLCMSVRGAPVERGFTTEI